MKRLYPGPSTSRRQSLDSDPGLPDFQGSRPQPPPNGSLKPESAPPCSAVGGALAERVCRHLSLVPAAGASHASVQPTGRLSWPPRLAVWSGSHLRECRDPGLSHCLSCPAGAEPSPALLVPSAKRRSRKTSKDTGDSKDGAAPGSEESGAKARGRGRKPSTKAKSGTLAVPSPLRHGGCHAHRVSTQPPSPHSPPPTPHPGRELCTATLSPPHLGGNCAAGLLGPLTDGGTEARGGALILRGRAEI